MFILTGTYDVYTIQRFVQLFAQSPAGDGPKNPREASARPSARLGDKRKRRGEGLYEHLIAASEPHEQPSSWPWERMAPAAWQPRLLMLVTVAACFTAEPPPRAHSMHRGRRAGAREGANWKSSAASAPRWHLSNFPPGPCCLLMGLSISGNGSIWLSEFFDYPFCGRLTRIILRLNLAIRRDRFVCWQRGRCNWQAVTQNRNIIGFF